MIKACYIRIVGFFTGDEMTEEKKKEIQQSFINIGKRNIFTERGRVKPGDTVSLLPSVAGLYEGLKRKQATKK